MAQFFEIIGNKYPQLTAQFFSDHPNPENRVKDVDALIPELGPPKEGKKDSPEFQAVKKRLLAMPAPPKATPAPCAASGPGNPPPAPSSRWVKYQGGGFSIDYPDNRQVQPRENAVTLAPPGRKSRPRSLRSHPRARAPEKSAIFIPAFR